MLAIKRSQKGFASFFLPGKTLKHPLTDIGLKNFLADWEKLKAEDPNIRI